MPGVYFIMLQAAEAHAGLFQATRPIHRANGASANRPERQAAMTASLPAQDTGRAKVRTGTGAQRPSVRDQRSTSSFRYARRCGASVMQPPTAMARRQSGRAEKPALNTK